MYIVNRWNGAKIKDVRLRKTLSRNAVYEKTGIAEATIMRLEKFGRANLNTITAVCKLLKLDISDVRLPDEDSNPGFDRSYANGNGHARAVGGRAKKGKTR
jgi:DNA-binding Xre family transcriptional regulator